MIARCLAATSEQGIPIKVHRSDNSNIFIMHAETLLTQAFMN